LFIPGLSENSEHGKSLAAHVQKRLTSLSLLRAENRARAHRLGRKFMLLLNILRPSGAGIDLELGSLQGGTIR